MSYMDALQGNGRTIAPVVLRGTIASRNDSVRIAADEHHRSYASSDTYRQIDIAMRSNRMVGI